MNIKHLIIAILLLTALQTYAADVYEPINIAKKEVVFSNSSRQISVFDPTPQTNASGSLFPGGRGANQLVIYTPAFGERTNTNEYGTEAVVQGNIVTVISGANSFIPLDGIVISGHGTAKGWMTKNIAVGTKVHIDQETGIINVYTTSESYMFEAEDKINEAKNMIDFYKKSSENYDAKEANNHIQEAQDYLKKAKKDSEDEKHVQKYSELAIKEADNALNNVLPYIKNETKGVWIRPTETTEAQIIATLNNMQKTGFDNVFLETFYHGKTIYPSKAMAQHGFITQNEQFIGIDPLKIWIKEAHKRNIKIHIWFQSFYAGNIPPSINPKSILAVHPEWGNKTGADYLSSTPTMSRSEHNGFFLDPANPEVQDFLLELLTEIICTYKPDGINLDYIRYPQSVSKTENGNWGYTEYARNDFTQMYGKDPINLTTKDVLWKEWENYRRENITNFVRKAGTTCKQNGVYVSTVIFPDAANALATKQQDWRTWSKRNYVNGFTPLFLTYDPKMVASMMNNVMAVKAPTTDIFAGIFVTFMDGSKEDLIRQIHETRKLKANGVVLFDYAHTTSKYTATLTESAFKYVPKSNMASETEKPKKKGFRLFKLFK